MYEMLFIPLLVLVGVDDPQSFFESVEEKDSWSFFKNVEVDDFFDYNICDPLFQNSYTGQKGQCYAASFEIKNIISVNDELFYFVKVIISPDDGETVDKVFLIDGTDYKINYIFLEDRDYANSFQNTIFWKNWGNVIDTTHGASTINLQEYDDSTAMIITERTIADNGEIQHVALYKNFETSQFTINDAIPMPISAEIFTNGPTADTTIPLFSFELVNYSVTDGEFEYGERERFPEIINSHHEVEWQ